MSFGSRDTNAIPSFSVPFLGAKTPHTSQARISVFEKGRHRTYEAVSKLFVVKKSAQNAQDMQLFIVNLRKKSTNNTSFCEFQFFRSKTTVVYFDKESKERAADEEEGLYTPSKSRYD
jgi:hypothetical protein